MSRLSFRRSQAFLISSANWPLAVALCTSTGQTGEQRWSFRTVTLQESVERLCQTIPLNVHCMAGLSTLRCVNCVTLQRYERANRLQQPHWLLNEDGGLAKPQCLHFAHRFARHYANISLIKYIYSSYEAHAFIFTWATLQTRQVRLASQLPHTVRTDWRGSHCTCCMSTCVEYGSIKSWQLRRREGCEMVGGLHSSSSPQFFFTTSKY